MIEKKTNLIHLVLLGIIISSTFLLFYQVKITKKLKNELDHVKKIRSYYIQFLNAASEQLKKKILEYNF